MRGYLLECVMIAGARKGSVFILGDPAQPMTHEQAITFKNAHTQHPFQVLRLREVSPTFVILRSKPCK